MEFIQELLGGDVKAGLLIVLNLVLIESLLSVDNAAVLATMVLDLPKEQRNRALKYGIIGAYVFRGLCLFLAGWLVKVWFLKPLGGLYLLYLAFNYFKGKGEEGAEEAVDKNKSWLYRSTVGALGPFWSTVALVEVMDLVFSIDNVFAAVALTDHMPLIYAGVFIGILAMRFVAQGFVRLMERYPFLETAAFVVIGLLGLKLLASVYSHFQHDRLAKWLESEAVDSWVSILTVAIFVVPVATSYFWGIPKRHSKAGELTANAEKVLDKQDKLL
jgi:YkoY family integral membrane protein